MSSPESQVDQLVGCLLPGLGLDSRASHLHLYRYSDRNRRAELLQIVDEIKGFVFTRADKTLLDCSDIEILMYWKEFALANRESYMKFSLSLLQGYYADSNVLKDLGLQDTSHFPLGIKVHQADLSMLEPVYNRGPIFRS